MLTFVVERERKRGRERRIKVKGRERERKWNGREKEELQPEVVKLKK